MNLIPMVRSEYKRLVMGINDFKKCYKPQTNIVEDDKGDMVIDSHNILPVWWNLFSQLWTLHGVNDVRETEICTAEPLLPQPSAYKVEMAIDKLKRHISPSTDQIPAELIKAGGRTICSDIHKLINLIQNKKVLLEVWKESIIVPIYKRHNKKRP
jgi:hypothetical protein